MDMSKSKRAAKKEEKKLVERLEQLPEGSEQSIYKLLFEPRKAEDAKK